jgi:hypothetical protein
LDEYGALVRRLKAGDHSQSGCFSAAARAKQTQALLVLDGERHAVHRAVSADSFAGIVGPTFSGLEDLTVNGNSNGESVNLQGCYAFWLKNVEITGWAYFGFHMQWCASIEVRGCSWHDPATYGWSRGYAIQYDAVNNTLFEDNIIWHNQAGFMIQ